MNIFYQFYLKIVYFFSQLYRAIFIYENPKKEFTILNQTERYVKERTDQFNKKNNGSSNCQAIFYNKDEFFAMIREQNNDIEEVWKTRILLENTPRGNIVMFYDVYKQGFSYYSDSNSMPYNVLNAVAMKYVNLYFCRDFFVDSEGVTKENESPLINLYHREPVKPKNKVEQNSTKKIGETSAFAKLKNYNKPIRNTNKLQDTTTKSDSSPEEEVIRNKFIYLGKMVNFPFIKKEKRALPQNGFKTNLLDGVTSESKLQKQVLNYKDFKALTKAKDE
jgi:hypothetical protein